MSERHCQCLPRRPIDLLYYCDFIECDKKAVMIDSLQNITKFGFRCLIIFDSRLPFRLLEDEVHYLEPGHLPRDLHSDNVLLVLLHLLGLHQVNDTLT